MKSFLKKLGAALFAFASTAIPVIGEVDTLIRPLLGSGQTAQLVTTGINDLTAMGTQAVTIETALQGKPGPEKLQALIPLVGGIVKTSEMVAGKKISDEPLFTKAVQEFAQATVDLLNSIHPDEVKVG